MRNSLNLAGAFVGIIVGAGFASGQEVMQFFTNFGIYSFPAVLISMILFAFLGMQIAQLGSHMKSMSHKEIIYKICGRHIGVVADFILSFFLFGVGVVMLAGAGSIFEQQLGVSASVGSMAMTLAVMVTLLFNVKSIMRIISAVTPFLLAIMIILAAYSFFTTDTIFAEIKSFSNVEAAAAPNWVLSTFLYVSFNIAVGFSMLAVMGGTIRSKKEAGIGGVIGGVLLGILLLLINAGMLANLDQLHGVEMPTLYIANQISPVFGTLLTIALLAMVYNTAVGMIYAFAVRFIPAESKRFKVSVIVLCLVGFCSSFFGFTTLVGTVYPIMGYFGFVLIAGVTVSWFRADHKASNVIGEKIYFQEINTEIEAD